MYNEELKQRYIKEKEAEVVISKGFLSRLFEKSAPFEEELGKDIYDFTTPEIINYYKTLNVNTLDSLYVMNSAYSQYEQWCLQQNLVIDCQNHFLELSRKTLSQYINVAGQQKKIVTRQQVYNWCGDLYNASDSFVLISLFEGLSGKNYCEIANAKIGDLNGNNFTTCTGRTIEVSDKFVEIANEANDETVYQGITKARTRQFPLVPGIYIIKNYPNVKEEGTPFQRGRRIYNKITRSLIYLGVDNYINGNDLLVSGMVDMVGREMKKYNLDFHSYVYSDHLVDIEKQYNKRITKCNFYDQYKEYFK